MAMMLRSRQALYAPETGAGSGDGASGAAGAPGGAGPAGVAGGATGKPWYDGKADAELIGHWDNKGWKKDDPVSIAIEASKAARELQKHFGVPADQLIRLPKDLNDEAGMKPVYSRLGVPAEAKDYDFTTIKYADGTDLEAGFLDSMRAALHKARVAKDAAPEVVKAVVKFLADADAAEAAEVTTNKNTQIAKLKRDWGPNEKINEGVALQGANRLGLSQEEYNKIADAIGWDRAPEIFRKIGAGTREDTFVDGTTGTNPTTVNGARARLAELQADREWSAKVVSSTGGAKEKAEFKNLMALIHGEAA